MSYRAWEPNAIGSIVPPFGGSSGGGGGGGVDRFAPKYLVGNVANGDSATAYSAGGFSYIPDPGDGTGIEAALLAADASAPGGVRGDVWIRPGTYDLDAGSTASPLVIPSGVRVQGAGGSATIILGRASGDQGVFVLRANAQLANLTVVGQTSTSTTGSVAVVLIDGSGVLVENVAVNMNAQVGAIMDTAILVQGVEEPWQEVKILGCSIGGGAYGVRFTNGEEAVLGDSTVTACFINAVRVDSSATLVRIVGCHLFAEYKNVAPTTVIIESDRNVLSSNSIKAEGENNGPAGIGVQITADHNACASNEIKITHGTVAIAVSGDNNVIVANVSGATTPVQNTGAGNEVAHNI